MEALTNRTARRILAAAALAALALAGCGPSDTASGEAIVRAVDPVANRVTLDHGNLPGMMQAMRMDFGVADPALLEGLAPGDEIEIEVRDEGDGVYTLTKVVRLAEEDAAAE